MSVLHFRLKKCRLGKYVRKSVCIPLVGMVIFHKVTHRIGLFEKHRIRDFYACCLFNSLQNLQKVILSQLRCIFESCSYRYKEYGTLFTFRSKGRVGYRWKTAVKERFVWPPWGIINSLGMFNKVSVKKESMMRNSL